MQREDEVACALPELHAYVKVVKEVASERHAILRGENGMDPSCGRRRSTEESLGSVGGRLTAQTAGRGPARPSGKPHLRIRPSLGLPTTPASQSESRQARAEGTTARPHSLVDPANRAGRKGNPIMHYGHINAVLRPVTKEGPINSSEARFTLVATTKARLSWPWQHVQTGVTLRALNVMNASVTQGAHDDTPLGSAD